MTSVKSVLFIIREGTINSKFVNDQAVIDRLTTTLGHSVTTVESDNLVSGDLTGKDLIVVSGSVFNTDSVTTAIANVIKSSTIPIISCKAAVQFKLDMAGAGSINAIGGLTTVRMNGAESSNPVSAGQTGDVVVYSGADAMNLGWDYGVNAVKIAERPGFATQAAIYYYNSGVEMLNIFNAPAKRAGFFLDKDAFLNAVVWDFFDALVAFMLT